VHSIAALKSAEDSALLMFSSTKVDNQVGFRHALDAEISSSFEMKDSWMLV